MNNSIEQENTENSENTDIVTEQVIVSIGNESNVFLPVNDWQNKMFLANASPHVRAEFRKGTVSE